MKELLITFALSLSFQIGVTATPENTTQRDTVIVQAFTFQDPSPEGWNAPYRGKFMFPMGPLKWERIMMVKTLKCDSATKGDQYPCGEWDYLTHTLVFKPKGDTVEAFQLGSFVTPYGKRLKMGGEQGWTWFYDVTDYAPLLRGLTEIESGNNQELLDLKFLFIPGTPPREVISVENLYPFGTYQYSQLADDSVLKQREVVLNPQAQGFLLRARISGHGHEGPRNCCEWDSKTHTYYIDDWDHYRWNVWKDCGFNPIYPQGGTWPFDRAGWCPGTKVDEYDFDLTGKYHGGDTLLIDYGIEPYRDNGERNGEFRMSHQLITYGPPNFSIDARIDDIIAPSDKDDYSRINPVCSNPVVVIRNTGRLPLKSLTINYGLKNGEKSQFIWKGLLSFMETEEVLLPDPNWKGMTEGCMFQVILDKPNNMQDEYPANNIMTSKIRMPQLLPESFVLHIETNDLGRAKDNTCQITDINGKILFERYDFEDSTTYNDRIFLEEGCYEFRLLDSQEDGMVRHWWNCYDNPDMVGKNGRIEIWSTEGDTLQRFPADFGQELLFRFRTGNWPR